jgi:hypothetical protein
MRAAADRLRIEALLEALGRRVREPHTVYLAGGASAVVEGWRESTIDVDLRPEPDSDELLWALSELKERLDINIETASPLDFLPALEHWRERSPHISSHGRVHVRHMDFRLQALAKLERASEQDVADVRAMVQHGLVSVDALAAAFVEMQGGLHRFPAIDRPAFAARVQGFLDRCRE